jgi:hypothetical protein
MGEANRGAGTSGMAMYICKAFLHDPEDREFNLARQALEFGRYIELYVDPATSRKSIYIATKGGCESCFIQQGRMQ